MAGFGEQHKRPWVNHSPRLQMHIVRSIFLLPRVLSFPQAIVFQ